jgi:hypothetical protein
MHLPHTLIAEVIGGAALVLLLGGIYLCRLGATNQKKYDYLKDPPLVWICGIPRGLVQIRGKVVVDNPLISPLTQAPCSYCCTTIARQNPSKPGQFKTIQSEPKESDFYIDDGTGRVLVIPAGADYDLPQTYSVEIDINHGSSVKDSTDQPLGRPRLPTEEHVLSYLARKGIGKGGANAGVKSDDSSGVYRVTEHCLMSGEETSVFGSCEVCFEPDYPHGRKVICKNDHLPTLLITKSIEMKVGLRLHLIAVVSFTLGLLMIGLSLAGVLFLVYPQSL